MKLQRIYQPYRRGVLCSVVGCCCLAVVTAVLEDQVAGWGHWIEQDMDAPFLCAEHLEEDRRRHRDPRSERFTNCRRAAGWSAYLPLAAAVAGRR